MPDSTNEICTVSPAFTLTEDVLFAQVRPLLEVIEQDSEVDEYVAVPPGETLTTIVHEELPDGAVAWNAYRLLSVIANGMRKPTLAVVVLLHTPPFGGQTALAVSEAELAPPNAICPCA